LNSQYGTRELANRQTRGTPGGVTLAAGPNGKTGGSFQFTGQASSYIEFPNNRGLDTKRSITMLRWLYPQSADVTDQSSIIKQVVHGVFTCAWYQESSLLVLRKEIINLHNL